MSDTFGLSSNNPCMVIDSQDRLWLVHPTLLGVPKWTWGSALLRYSISSQYNMPGRPIWDKVDILVPHIPELEQMEPENPLKSRLGWMSRAHPFIRSDGAVIIPLANENFDIAVMAITQARMVAKPGHSQNPFPEGVSPSRHWWSSAMVACPHSSAAANASGAAIRQMAELPGQSWQ